MAANVVIDSFHCRLLLFRASFYLFQIKDNLARKPATHSIKAFLEIINIEEFALCLELTESKRIK
ncbi:hypothetical protein BCT92_10710 [Vibrio sp. 10N.261.52.E5]|uniref:HEPN domain-containing protein n=1 Tax=Vibrio cyclitrophicus TaxID=47951 RepID=A0A7Z1S2U4_9VIBR|nr:hypothetical protein BCT92_10710 [Vibrio sp. 10N.261.52.E5]PMP25092.1 hypothetical protein BCS91_12610 [Vibrio cyclitrophicus]PMP29957.1 hypothetical protein BCS90_00665 [Vibrio cyclitrophicus]